MANKSLRLRTYQLFNAELKTSVFKTVVNYLLIALIISNVIAVVLESDTAIGQQYHDFFYYFEAISVSIFLCEYLLRVWSCVEAKNKHKRTNLSRRIRYIFSPMAIIDLLAILPFFLSLIFAVDLRTLRLLRIMRILKLSHYFSGFNIFVTVIKKELRSIMAATMVMFFLITIAASLMYTLENKAQPEVFGSILQAYWWSVVTMTTVGYGDVVPQTGLGKFISVIIMLLGVGIVALPAGLLAARFADELRERKQNLNAHIERALEDGKITAQEYQQLHKLAIKLELKIDDLKQGIKLQKKLYNNEHKHHSYIPNEDKTCPHCHKVI